VARFLALSGLTVSQVSVIAKLKRGRLSQSVPQDLVLKIRRRLTRFEKVFGPVAQKLGHKNWGQWWTCANEGLGGRSPIEVLKDGGTLDLEVLLGQRLGDKWLFQCWDLLMLLHRKV
jgi:hypothetical protein